MVSALPSGRRPGHRPCPRYLTVSRSDVPPSIRWWCTSCTDEGVIGGWEKSPFDLRSPTMGHSGTMTFRAVIPPHVGGTLRSLLFLDSSSEQLVFRASRSDDGIVHEDNPRRQKRLDAALDALEDVLKQI